MSRNVRGVAAVLSLATLAACGDSPTHPDVRSARGVVILHAIGSLKGITVNDTASAGGRISFPPEYDGGGFELASDTALTTSSSWGTNKLYVVTLPGGAVREVEMPAGANAAGATLAAGFRGARVAVALRAAQSVGLVAFDAAGTASVTQLTTVGRCPYDVAAHAGSLWVVDYNAACDASYASLGASRLIRVAANGDARDTIDLPGLVNATSITVVGDVAYVSAIGVADYSQWPDVNFVTPGAIAVVDLRTRQVLRTISLPEGTNGASLEVGLDGRLYVVAYLDPSYEHGVFAIDPASGAFVGVREAGRQTLRLTTAAGTRAACAAATADAAGRLYCAVNQGAGMSTSVIVFDLATGSEVRSFTTGGTGAVDLALR